MIPGETQVFDVRDVDLVERAVALLVIGSADRKPFAISRGRRQALAVHTSGLAASLTASGQKKSKSENSRKSLHCHYLLPSRRFSAKLEYAQGELDGKP